MTKLQKLKKINSKNYSIFAMLIVDIYMALPSVPHLIIKKSFCIRKRATWFDNSRSCIWVGTYCSAQYALDIEQLFRRYSVWWMRSTRLVVTEKHFCFNSVASSIDSDIDIFHHRSKHTRQVYHWKIPLHFLALNRRNVKPGCHIGPEITSA